MGKHALACLLLFVCLHELRAAEYLPGANSFGAFTTESADGKTGCASLDSSAVAPGMSVDIVVLSTPQRLLKGKITAQASAECTRYFQASESTAFYEVALTKGRFEPHELGLVVLPDARLARTSQSDLVVQNQGKPYRVFECASHEGIHLGVRSRTVPATTIWHDYLYVGIDVEPTCSKADYAGFEALRSASRHEGGRGVR